MVHSIDNSVVAWFICSFELFNSRELNQANVVLAAKLLSNSREKVLLKGFNCTSKGASFNCANLELGLWVIRIGTVNTDNDINSWLNWWRCIATFTVALDCNWIKSCLCCYCQGRGNINAIQLYSYSTLTVSLTFRPWRPRRLGYKLDSDFLAFFGKSLKMISIIEFIRFIWQLSGDNTTQYLCTTAWTTHLST